MQTKRFISGIALIMIVAVGACGDGRELVSGSDLSVLEGATLIDGTGGPPIADAALVLSGKHILRIGHKGQFRYPSGVTVQDMSGRWITPGFIDMHVHPTEGTEEAMMQMLLAFGVTTVRMPGVDGADDQGLRLRDQIARGEILGPRVFTGGKFIDGPKKTIPTDVEVKTEAEMRAEVRRQAAFGVDLVKLYWSTPIEFIRAAVEEAHTRNIQVIGHLRTTSWTAAAEAGIDGLVHSGGQGPTHELVSPDQQAQLREMPQRTYYERLAEWIDFESPAFDKLVTTLVKNRVTVDPTLVTMQSLYFGDDLSVLERLEPGLAPPAVRAAWGQGWETGNPFLAQDLGREKIHGKALLGIALKMTREFHRRGVHLAAGTDVGMPWITPGVSFHREMELLVEAGIPPSEVLVIATRNGAEGLRIQNAVGTIAPSMSADLVVLREDPTKDIHNTRAIEFVYKEGRRYDPRELLSRIQ